MFPWQQMWSSAAVEHLLLWFHVLWIQRCFKKIKQLFTRKRNAETSEYSASALTATTYKGEEWRACWETHLTSEQMWSKLNNQSEARLDVYTQRVFCSFWLDNAWGDVDLRPACHLGWLWKFHWGVKHSNLTGLSWDMSLFKQIQI